jgi:ATP diphosphatase
LGDTLLALANLARHLQLDPETALRGANARFARRFVTVEAHARAHAGAGLDALEGAWQQAKRQETGEN